MKNLKTKILATIVVIGFAASANAADKYKLDQYHTNVTWSANHFGFSSPSGKFADAEGLLILDEKDPSKSSIEVTLKIDSLQTGIKKFDDHLKSEDFFNVERFPTAKFVSKKVEMVKNGKAKVYGDFTLLGITKTVVLDVRLNKIGTNPFSQKKTSGFSAKGTIKRSDFGMSYGVPGVSDDVKLDIEAEAILESDLQSEKK